MDSASERNPLGFVVMAVLITLPLDFYYYVIQHYLVPFGTSVIVGKTAFLILYFRRSRFAWHIGFVLTAAITALSLVLLVLGAEAGASSRSQHPSIELAIVIGLLVYQWRIRERYFRYIQIQKNTSM